MTTTDQQPDQRKMVLFGAPTGGGKTETMKGLLKACPLIQRAITTTTRPPRTGERDGVDYYFVAIEQFKAGQANGEFVESDADYTSDVYGLTWAELKRIYDAGKVPIMSLTLPGILALKSKFPNALTIFLGPERFEDLEARIPDRNDKEARLAKAREEIATAHQHYSVILNAPNGGIPLLIRRSLLLINDYIEGPDLP